MSFMMRSFASILFAAVAFISTSVAVPLNVHPGTAADIVITSNNTVNATRPASDFTANTGRLALSLVNNLNGGQVNCYVTGLDSNNELVILQTDGTFYKPTTTASTPQPINAPISIPMAGYGQTTQIAIPGYISAARVWFAEGELQFFVVSGASGEPSLVEPSAVNPSDPSSNVNWGFVELTNTQDGGLYANISYVDFVGLPLGMTLITSSGQTQSALGLTSTAVDSVCNDLYAQSASDGQAWGDLCVKGTSGNNLRVLNPTDYLSINNGAFSSYWTSYVDNVWSYYSSNTLTIDTQAAAGNVACRVSGDMLYCNGDNRGYAKPNAGDIFGCNSGPFGILPGDNGVHYAVVPRLCAAFNRGTFFVNGGSTQPGPTQSEFYTTNPSNEYSRIVHKYEVDSKGYAFSYDDVNADGSPNASGVVAAGDPSVLQITVGGPSP